MLRSFQNQSRSVIVLLAVLAVALSGCGGSSGTPAPAGSGASATSSQPGETGQPGATSASTDSGSGLSGAANALANITSYKFTMTMMGSLGDTLSMLPSSNSSGNPELKVNGTCIVNPDRAADITVVSVLHIVSIGGSDYQDMGLTGSFTKTDSSGTGLVDSLSPDAVFSSFDFTSGYNVIGSEKKNGVDTDHYQADKPTLDELGTVAAVQGATWTADVWVARDGNYPVSLAIVAKASDASVVYERVFDITKINDPTNKVTAPTNVTGA